MAHLSLDTLVKSYDGAHRAVDGISLAIEKGEFVTFLGPSGSGKTTTLMMIAGFEEPSAGDIRLAGRSLVAIPAHKRNIGMVFQNYALFPHMSAGENVAFPLKMRGVAASEIGKRVADMLAAVDLARFADRHPRELSGGQQQRVALARALVFEPDILLLDEPLGALDKNLREQMQVEIKRIHRRLGVTTVYVTHDQTEAMTMSDRVAVFNQGRIEQFAPPLEVYARPSTRFVGAFVGDSNFLEATVSADGRLAVATLGATFEPGDARLDRARGADILVRPESIRVVRPGSVPPDFAYALRVDGRVNYGDSVLLLGQIANQALRVRAPAADAALIADGATATVGWNRADMHVLPRA